MKHIIPSNMSSDLDLLELSVPPKSKERKLIDLNKGVRLSVLSAQKNSQDPLKKEPKIKRYNKISIFFLLSFKYFLLIFSAVVLVGTANILPVLSNALLPETIIFLKSTGFNREGLCGSLRSPSLISPVV